MSSPEPQYTVGLPEVQLSGTGVCVEIVSFPPQEINICLPHHCFLSWLSPPPVVARGCFHVDGDVSRFSPIGNLLFIPAGVPTQSFFTESHESRRGIVVRIDTWVFDRLLATDLRQRNPMTMRSLNLRDPDILHAMRLLSREVQAPGFASKTYIENISTAMLIQLLRRYADRGVDENDRGGLADWQLRKLTDYIASRCDVDAVPSIAELAEMLGISEGHLRRTFKQSAGCTLAEYLRNARIDRARTLIAQTELPIKTIAARLGFSSQNGFALAFQRTIGETPGAFRKRVRAEEFG